MERLILNKDLRIRMGLQARKSMERYDKTCIDKQWLDIVQTCISSRNQKILPLNTIRRQGKLNLKFCKRYNVKRFYFLYDRHPGLYWTGICLRDDLSFSFKLLRNRLRQTLKKIDYRDIPIIIYNRNEIEGLKSLIGSLEGRGYHNICIIDDSSTDKETLDYYDTLTYQVFLQKEERGYSQLWASRQIFNVFRKSYYIYTRSDFEIKETLPKNFVSILLKTLRRFPTCDRIGIRTASHHNGDIGTEEPVSTYLNRTFVSDEFALYAPYTSGVRDYGHFNLQISDDFTSIS